MAFQYRPVPNVDLLSPTGRTGHADRGRLWIQSHYSRTIPAKISMPVSGQGAWRQAALRACSGNPIVLAVSPVGRGGAGQSFVIPARKYAQRWSRCLGWRSWAPPPSYSRLCPRRAFPAPFYALAWVAPPYPDPEVALLPACLPLFRLPSPAPSLAPLLGGPSGRTQFK